MPNNSRILVLVGASVPLSNCMFISVTSQGDWGHVTTEGLDLRVKELGNLNAVKFNDGDMPIHNSLHSCLGCTSKNWNMFRGDLVTKDKMKRSSLVATL